jgi:ferrochelatase
MRLWHPRLAEVVADLDHHHKICLIPMAPFSIEVYRAAAERELAQLPEERRPQLRCVGPWGTQPRLLDAYLSGISATLSELPAHLRERVPVILTAHSLPSAVIRGGDQYQQQFLATAGLVAARLQQPVLTCFQSQGAEGGPWLGPDLLDGLKRCAAQGPGPVLVAPIGFFAEHVETLYDLDIEARAQAASLGLHLLRVPTVRTHPGLIDALQHAADQAIGCSGLK